MEACYVYLGCEMVNCIMQGQKNNKRCWEVEGTLCNHHGIEIIRKALAGRNKEDICMRSHCIYYRAAKEGSTAQRKPQPERSVEWLQ